MKKHMEGSLWFSYETLKTKIKHCYMRATVYSNTEAKEKS